MELMRALRKLMRSSHGVSVQGHAQPGSPAAAHLDMLTWWDRAGSCSFPPLLLAAGLQLCTGLAAVSLGSHLEPPHSALAAPEGPHHKTHYMG